MKKQERQRGRFVVRRERIFAPWRPNGTEGNHKSAAGTSARGSGGLRRGPRRRRRRAPSTCPHVLSPAVKSASSARKQNKKGEAHVRAWTDRQTAEDDVAAVYPQLASAGARSRGSARGVVKGSFLSQSYARAATLGLPWYAPHPTRTYARAQTRLTHTFWAIDPQLHQNNHCLPPHQDPSGVVKDSPATARPLQGFARTDVNPRRHPKASQIEVQPRSLRQFPVNSVRAMRTNPEPASQRLWLFVEGTH